MNTELLKGKITELKKLMRESGIGEGGELEQLESRIQA